MRTRRRSGFTLIELLVVVLIIGVLAGMALNRVWKTKERAYVASMVSDLRSLVSAEEEFHADSMRYTTDFAQMPSARRSADVTIVVDAAADSTWQATASHPGTDKRCVVRGGVGEPSGNANIAICN